MNRALLTTSAVCTLGAITVWVAVFVFSGDSQPLQVAPAPAEEVQRVIPPTFPPLGDSPGFERIPPSDFIPNVIPTPEGWPSGA